MNNQGKQPWLDQFAIDPVLPLLTNSNQCIRLAASEVFFDEKVDPELCWNTPSLVTLLTKQHPKGYWKYPQKSKLTTSANLNQYQTYLNLGKLVDLYNLDCNHHAVRKAATYFFSVQTNEGDFRGIYDKQYTPNYTAGITELLIKAGYTNDSRVTAALEWLIHCRQKDGGWALPFRTKGYHVDVTYNHPVTIHPDFDRPSSYMITAVVLRAFAVLPSYKDRIEIKNAGELVTSFIFKRDRYPDRQDKKYWTQFVYPFCYSDLLSVLDTLSLLGFSPEHPEIEKGLQWFIDEQLDSGAWDLKITAGRDKKVTQLYLNLAICKVFKQFYLNSSRSGVQ